MKVLKNLKKKREQMKVPLELKLEVAHQSEHIARYLLYITQVSYASIFGGLNRGE